MASQPLLDFGMFLCGIVLRDQMDFSAFRCDLVNHAQEFQQLLMPVPVVAHADYGAVESAHGNKQGCRSAATFFSGRSGCARSSAWIFSSAQRTMAGSGGLR